MNPIRFYRSLIRAYPERTWTLDLPLLLIAFYALIFGLVIPKIFGHREPPLILSPQLFFLASCLFAAFYAKLHPADLGLSPRSWRQDLKVTAVAVAVPIVAVALTIGPLFLYRLLTSHSLSPLFAGTAIRYPDRLILQMVILAPLTEELFFRGLLIPPLEREMSLILARIASPRRRELAVFGATLLASALLFSLAHGYLKFGAFLLGLGTAWIYCKTGSILPAIILHAICNGWGPFLAYYFPGVFKYVEVFFR